MQIIVIYNIIVLKKAVSYKDWLLLMLTNMMVSALNYVWMDTSYKLVIQLAS